MGTSIARSILGAAGLGLGDGGLSSGSRAGMRRNSEVKLRTRSARSTFISQSIAQGNDRDVNPKLKTNADCARMCEERGGRFVLQTPEKVYKLDTQASGGTVGRAEGKNRWDP